ncbi:bifunctional phosphoribosylaminoimidazolecarboxamide formyltransferase/inosine monophosphate cyclohydrolase [Actinophytocola xinjiangensis]|uniref:Bifunctional purine biosynthesis protein PurH n=2 Tax=Actinophytocola xinjiangensis TaxID=485602 RepID=A0A7Z0WEH4_9PSEU|nr:bifunctional phosphoribosylaminoimidazolecarboxamide formyltransferase/inosine monophosphate cyclohydrolase [Actinophytocola xinjiangensis]
MVSGSGTLLQALLDASAAPDFPVRVVAVGADRAGIEGLARAERAGVPSFVVRLRDHGDRTAWDAALAEAVAEHRPDLVVSAGFMKILGPAVLARFAGRVVNTHPALLPAFPGAHAVADALAHGVAVTGCTVHLVDAGVDTGPIVAQQAVAVAPADDVDALHERIKVVERRLLVDVVARLAREGYTMHGRKVSVGVTDQRRPVRRALIGVSDKAGLLELATGLHANGVEIVSTGGTARTIADAGVPVTPVEQVTGFPESLDGRVKTLHPRVHAGLLADLRKPAHVEQLAGLGIEPFDLLVVNLYPFERTVASGAAPEECVEQIDIGGPAMVRAAAKNHASVAVVVDPTRYDWLLEQVRDGGFTLADRRRLAVEAYRHTASYDIAVATWMGETLAPEEDGGFPSWVGASWQRRNTLRYGENPHQRAALYVAGDVAGGDQGLATAEQLHGKEMSYNNYTDADAAVRAAYDHEQPCVAIIKHANPCGIAVSGVDGSIADAHRRAHACDPLSAFGGVIAANREVTVDMAEQVAEVFTEVIVAPSYADGAVEVLSRKKNVRILVAAPPRRGGAERRAVSGGLLVQSMDLIDAAGDDPASWTLATGKPVDEDVLADLAFAWRTCRAVKSNAIVLAAGGATVGVGMGQVNRVDAARLAVERAGDRAAGSVAASDAFFPFPDGPQLLFDAGVLAIVQPGGSVRDAEVVAAAEAAGASLYLTGTRHFAH